MRSRLCFVTISLSFAPDRGAWALSAFGLYHELYKLSQNFTAGNMRKVSLCCLRLHLCVVIKLVFRACVILIQRTGNGRILGADQKDRSLWERDCVVIQFRNDHARICVSEACLRHPLARNSNNAVNCFELLCPT